MENENVQPTEEQVTTPVEETQITPAEQPTDDQGQAQSTPELTLVKMPDGRMLTPDGAAQEYARLQAEFTRKSQRLAELERKSEEAPKPKPWQQEDFNPQSWEEIMEHAANEAKERLRQEQEAQTTQEREREERLNAEIASIKQIDPTFDEEKVFTFANKRLEQVGISYPSLAAAYKDWKMFEDAQKTAEKRAIEAQKARAADPVSAAPATNNAPAEPPPGLSRSEKLAWYLKNS